MAGNLEADVEATLTGGASLAVAAAADSFAMAAGLRAPKDPSMEVREMAQEARERSRHTHTSQQFHPRVVSIAGKVDSGASDTELESWRIGPALSGASPSPTDTGCSEEG